MKTKNTLTGIKTIAAPCAIHFAAEGKVHLIFGDFIEAEAFLEEHDVADCVGTFTMDYRYQWSVLEKPVAIILHQPEGVSFSW